MTTLVRQFDREGIDQWAVVPSDADTLIGYCGFKATASAGVAELVYGLGSTHWGRGYATEAAQAALDFGFGTAGLTRVVAAAMTGNAASIRVLEKLGMVRQGVEPIGGHDEVVFQLDRASAGGHR